MREVIARVLAVPADRVSVKASTGNLAGGRALAAASRPAPSPSSGRRPGDDPAPRHADWGPAGARPARGRHVRIYSCGPTVYGPAHVGNFRSFLFADVLVRYLRWRGYRVTWVMNLTDVDDKIIRGAAAEGIGIEALAARHIEGFLADAATLRMTTRTCSPGRLPTSPRWWSW